MKLKNYLLPLALFSTINLVQAEVRTKVEEVSELNYNGKNLNITYRVVGGCQTHTGKAELDYDKDKRSITVNIFDTTPKEDYCESYRTVTFSINIKEEAAKLLEGVELEKAWSTKLILPSLVVKAFDDFN